MQEDNDENEGESSSVRNGSNEAENCTDSKSDTMAFPARPIAPLPGNAEEIIPSSFPQKLFEVLTDKQSEGIIEWLPHGLSWIIIDKKLLSWVILPKHFSVKSKYSSFTRKLNRWSFIRVTRGPETGSYYHPLFQRDNGTLCLQMSCLSTKKSQQVEPLNPIALGLGFANHASCSNPDSSSYDHSIHHGTLMETQHLSLNVDEPNLEQVNAHNFFPPTAFSTCVGEPSSTVSAAAEVQQSDACSDSYAEINILPATASGTMKYRAQMLANIFAQSQHLQQQQQFQQQQQQQQVELQKPLRLPPKPKTPSLRNSKNRKQSAATENRTVESV